MILHSMMHLAIIVITTQIGASFVPAAADAECSQSAQTSSKMLLNKLFCNYEPRDRPVQSEYRMTSVKIQMELRSLVINERWDTLEVHSWLLLKWNDERLKWNATEFNNEESVHIHSNKIWVPDLNLIDMSGSVSMGNPVDDMACDIDSTGLVLCVSLSVLLTPCTVDLTKWPYDTRTCKLRLSSLASYKDDLNLTLNGEGLFTSLYEKNRQWDLSNATHVTNSSHMTVDRSINFSFKLKRNPGGLTAVVLIPALILATITLVVFFMDARSHERLGVICVNVFSHCVYLTYLGVHLPPNGDTCPNILLFFRDSLLLVGASLFITLLGRRLDVASSAPPAWITTVTDAVLATMPVRIFMGGDINKVMSTDCGDDDQTSSKRNKLSFLAGLFDVITFFIFLIAYAIIIKTYVI